MSVEPQSSKAQIRSSTSASRSVQRLLNSVVIGLYRLTGGAIGGRMQGMSALLLTTTGRESGKRYTTPVLYRPENNPAC